MWFELSCIVIVITRVCASMKCARFMSFQKTSTAARTTPVFRPLSVSICSSCPMSVGSHSWWHCTPFHERRTQ